MSSEFACDVACANIPQDHCLIRAAGTDVAAVEGTVKTNKVLDEVFNRGCLSLDIHTVHKHL